ncbi:MAG: hypothetical protein M3N68_04030 [Actinomycetota bacterium]|nr:hypothetical protein [Actinomycetota bacterium]
MQLNDLIQALQRHRLLAAAAFVLCLAVSLAAAFVPAPRYRATTTVLVQPDPERAQFGTVQAVEFVMPALVAAAESRSVEAASRAQLPPAIGAADVDIAANAEPGTGVLHVYAVSTRSDAVAPLADAAAAELAQRQPANGLFLLDVLDPARPPDAPFSPAKPAILLSGTVLGIFSAVATALVMAAIRGRLDTAEEIRRRFGATVLGEIPVMSRRLSVASRPAELFQSGHHPRVVEAYQRLRANVEFALFSDQASSAAITVTSCSVGEGKSTVTANLGWAMASSGYDVLVIDGDLRRPVLHDYLGVAFDPGVSDTDAVTDIASLVRTSFHPGLGIIPAGTPDRHPSEVLGLALPRLLDFHPGPERIVLVDTPPVNSVAETVIAAAMTRHVILVVEARRRDLADLERAVLQLRGAGANLLGVVINRIAKRRDTLPDDYYFPVSGTTPLPKKSNAMPTVSPPQVGEKRAGGSGEDVRAHRQRPEAV